MERIEGRKRNGARITLAFPSFDTHPNSPFGDETIRPAEGGMAWCLSVAVHGIAEGLVRLLVGFETLVDIVEDLEQGLDRAG
jgi:hypothetical protein